VPLLQKGLSQPWRRTLQGRRRQGRKEDIYMNNPWRTLRLGEKMMTFCSGLIRAIRVEKCMVENLLVSPFLLPNITDSFLKTFAFVISVSS
jgi:hypothetical protein